MLSGWRTKLQSLRQAKCKMKTEIKKATDDVINQAAGLISAGEVVGMPTETVYGLAADATNIQAVKHIFEVKGRPQDNPLIVHISSYNMLEFVAKEIPSGARKLMNAFWPGPLTIVLPKSDNIPDTVSAGLDTVGVRVPGSNAALKFIEACGVPIAAPSANTSGKPSPTTAEHVKLDLNGKIPLIIDGGACQKGVESTVITVENDLVTILRPGFITAEDFISEGFEAEYSKGVFDELKTDEKVLSPGLKYKHYSPKANVILLDGEYEKVYEFAKSINDKETYFLLYNDDENFPCPHLSYGSTDKEQALNIYNKLREFDELNVKTVYAMCPVMSGVGKAVYNRMLRSAGFEVIKL